MDYSTLFISALVLTVSISCYFLYKAATKVGTDNSSDVNMKNC